MLQAGAWLSTVEPKVREWVKAVGKYAERDRKALEFLSQRK